MDALEEKVVIKAELNPGCLLEWLSVVDGKKTGTKRSELSGKVKRHLSALGWTFSYQPKKKREMRFKSPTGRWYYSLATACKACVHQDGFNQHQPEHQQHAPPQQQQHPPQQHQQHLPQHQQHQPQKKQYQPQQQQLYQQQKQSQQLQYQPQQLQYQPQPQQYQQQHLQYQPQTQRYQQQQLHYQPQPQQYQQQHLQYQPDPQQYQPQPQQYQPQQLQYQHQQQQQQQYVPTFDLSCSPRNLDESNQKQTKDEDIHRFEDGDIAGSTPNEEILSSDSIQFVPSFDISHHQHKTKRLKSCDTKGSTSFDEENSLAILPCSGVSNQQPKKKNSERVKDCDTAAFNKETPNKEKRRSSDSIDAPNQQQKKRRNTRTTRTAPFSSSTLNNEDKVERRPGKGKRLMKILQAMKKKEYIEKESERLRKDCGPDMNCEVCCVCHWGEDLFRCNGCPSAFHITCLGLSAIPQEELWFCPCCCCNICGSMDSPGNSMLMTCQQCQRRFHLRCLEDEPYIVSRTDWFCSSQCFKVFGKLKSLLRCKIAVGEDDLVWKLMRAPNEDEHNDHEQNSKLDSAIQIFHQGFDLTEDPLSGKDLVEELIFTKDETGATCGCYMVLIEKNNEPIMVAALRVEKHVAEIPLMATLPNYKTIEMCRMLMDELEKQMSQMGVCKLVLPVEEEGLATWTEQFGFSVMENSEKLEFVKHGMHEFVGTLLCHKLLR